MVVNKEIVSKLLFLAHPELDGKYCLLDSEGWVTVLFVGPIIIMYDPLTFQPRLHFVNDKLTVNEQAIVDSVINYVPHYANNLQFAYKKPNGELAYIPHYV